MRLVPQPRALQLSRPTTLAGAERLHGLDKGAPRFANAGRRRQQSERDNRIGSAGGVLQHALCRCWPDACHELQHGEAPTGALRAFARRLALKLGRIACFGDGAQNQSQRVSA